MANLALVDGRILVRVEILNWIFDGDNVVMLSLVDDVDHSRLSRTLAGAGWSGHQHQAILELGNVGELLRKAKRFQGGNIGGDNAHHDRIDAALLKDVDTKAGPRRKRVTKV